MPGGIPAKLTVAATLPIMTDTRCTCVGSAESAVVLDGAAPVAIVGDPAPAPVTYSVMVLPRWAVVMELKIAAAVALTFKVVDAVRPLLLITSVAGPAGTWYGIWRLICPDETYHSGAAMPLIVAATPPSAI